MKIDKALLMRFCDPRDHRDYIQAPFVEGDRIIASNGFVAVSVPREAFSDEAYPARIPIRLGAELARMIEKVVARAGEWRPLPAITDDPIDCNCHHGMVPKVITCETCAGSGYVTNCPQCRDSHDCGCCGGTGDRETNDLVVCSDCHGTEKCYPVQYLTGRKLNGNYYHLIQTIGPGVEYYRETTPELDFSKCPNVLFRLKDVDLVGLIMSIRED